MRPKIIEQEKPDIIIDGFEDVGIVSKNLYQFRELGEEPRKIIFINELQQFIWLGYLNKSDATYENKTLDKDILKKCRLKYPSLEWTMDFRDFLDHKGLNFMLSITLKRFKRVVIENE